MPPLPAAALLEPAREAFTQALQVAATVSGVLVVAAAVLVARLLRRGGEPRVRTSVAAPGALATEAPCT